MHIANVTNKSRPNHFTMQGIVCHFLRCIYALNKIHYTQNIIVILFILIYYIIVTYRKTICKRKIEMIYIFVR